jgi:hypothetical protein
MTFRCDECPFTYKADIYATQTDVCFVPIADMPASVGLRGKAEVSSINRRLEVRGMGGSNIARSVGLPYVAFSLKSTIARPSPCFMTSGAFGKIVPSINAPPIKTMRKI